MGGVYPSPQLGSVGAAVQTFLLKNGSVSVQTVHQEGIMGAVVHMRAVQCSAKKDCVRLGQDRGGLWVL